MQSRAVITNLFTRPLRHPSVSFIESCHRRFMADGSLSRSLGLKAEVLKSFRIGLLIRDGRQYLVIPYRDGSGNYESLRLVSPDGKDILIGASKGGSGSLSLSSLRIFLQQLGGLGSFTGSRFFSLITISFFFLKLTTGEMTPQ
jgi:hypothetical protein